MSFKNAIGQTENVLGVKKGKKTMIDFARFIEYQFENNVSETSYGEPQIWIELKSGRSVEITYEQYGLSEEEWYYSMRYHCNQEEYESDKYHGTMGVIEAWCVNGTIDMADHLSLLIDRYNEEIDDNSLYEFEENDI